MGRCWARWWWAVAVVVAARVAGRHEGGSALGTKRGARAGEGGAGRARAPGGRRRGARRAHDRPPTAPPRGPAAPRRRGGHRPAPLPYRGAISRRLRSHLSTDWHATWTRSSTAAARPTPPGSRARARLRRGAERGALAVSARGGRRRAHEAARPGHARRSGRDRARRGPVARNVLASVLGSYRRGRRHPVVVVLDGRRGAGRLRGAARARRALVGAARQEPSARAPAPGSTLCSSSPRRHHGERARVSAPSSSVAAASRRADRAPAAWLATLVSRPPRWSRATVARAVALARCPRRARGPCAAGRAGGLDHCGGDLPRLGGPRGALVTVAGVDRAASSPSPTLTAGQPAPRPRGERRLGLAPAGEGDARWSAEGAHGYGGHGPSRHARALAGSR